MSWVEGEELSESSAADVRRLCTILLNCYLIQLLETGLLHADPHPGTTGPSASTSNSSWAYLACRVLAAVGAAAAALAATGQHEPSGKYRIPLVEMGRKL